SCSLFRYSFFDATSTTELYTLSLHDALPIFGGWVAMDPADVLKVMRQESKEWIKDPAHPLAKPVEAGLFGGWEGNWVGYNHANRSEEHTSELQSRENLVCRLLLEKKKTTNK